MSEILWFPLTPVEPFTPTVLNLKLETLAPYRKSKVLGPEGLAVFFSALHLNPLISQGLCALLCPPLLSSFFGGSLWSFTLFSLNTAAFWFPASTRSLTSFSDLLSSPVFNPKRKRLFFWYSDGKYVVISCVNANVFLVLIVNMIVKIWNCICKSIY